MEILIDFIKYIVYYKIRNLNIKIIKFGGEKMPEISLLVVFVLLCIILTIIHRIFHAQYGDFRALVDIQHGYVIKGALPSRQLKYVLAWCEMHQMN